ncbi:hypothetical protein [Mycolicibacterium sp. XJ870]
MASVDWRDLPAYTLAELPPRTRHVALTPAVRWRVVVEDVVEIEHDVMLDAVLRIRAAGEESPTSIADLLQLPEDLVRHLLSHAAAARMEVSHDGRLQAGASRVSWIYRDVETGELWPHPSMEVPPLQLRFTTPQRARFDRGTAGRPQPVECLLMDTTQTTAAEPTSIELARFSRTSADINRRTALVSSGERCLVASPVIGNAAGHAIWTTRGAPHLTLSQRLTQLGQEREAVRRWLAKVPMSVATPHDELPLRQAIAELREVTDERRSGHQTLDTVTVLSRIGLCLSRFVDQFQYSHGISGTSDIDVDAAIRAGGRAGLSKGESAKMAQSERGSVGHKVLRLLLAKPNLDPLLLDFVRSAAAFTAISPESAARPAVDDLVDRTIDICDRLALGSEGTDGKQAG